MGRPWATWRGAGGGRPAGGGTGWTSWASTVGLVGIVVCLMVPLGSRWVDVLLAASLAGSMALMVASARSAGLRHMRSFPTLVLCATLFRLCINVSTTRLILTDGYAGEVVEAFATVVVRDDLLVGLVIFAVITAVQFLVITRGASRMAEVAARFALDALPGQQAALREEVAARTLTPAQASARRDAMLERADIYGALDGTARFVRGDAVVGLVIVTVNLLGGMYVGIVRLGMTPAQAIDRYGRLTVGDGLMAQVPALLVSMAAALLISRVEARRQERIGWGALHDPLTLVIPGAALALLAAVDGMPTLAFALLSCLSLGLALLVAWRAPGFERRGTETPWVHVEVAPSVPLPAPGTVAAYAHRLSEALGVKVAVVASTVSLPGGTALRVRVGDRVVGETAAVESSSEEGVVRAVDSLVRRDLGQLMSLEWMRACIDAARREDPWLAERALDGVSVVGVRAALLQMISEGVALPPTRAWMLALAEGPEFRDPATASTWATSLRLRTVHAWFGPRVERVRDEEAPVGFRLTPDLEAFVEEVVITRRTGAHGWRDREGGRARLRQSLEAAAGVVDAAERPLLVCRPRLRAQLAWVVRALSISADVVSAEELDLVWSELDAARLAWLGLPLGREPAE